VNNLEGIDRKLKGKKIMITGGTGSFGHQMTETLLKYDLKEIRIFSRGEDLQHRMAIEFPDSRLNFIIGDVRDYRRVLETTRGLNIIFNAAALKQVPDCESHPLEAVKTNILGACNVKEAAITNEVEEVVTISTDKAVKPVNVMGMTKAIQEKVVTADEVRSHNTKFMVVRDGNVIASRGSVIPLFKERVQKGLPLYVTDFRMTRFLLSLKDAVKLVFKALLDGKGGEIFVMKRPACLVKDLAEVMADGKADVLEGKIRPGEKIHETLVQEDEMRRAIEEDEYYIVCPYWAEGAPKLRRELFEYTSQNTQRLSKEELRQLLKKDGWL
jgi:UDP-N-acetylglucosamine 4,6-dehydratase